MIVLNAAAADWPTICLMDPEMQNTGPCSEPGPAAHCDVRCVMQGLEIGYRRAERLGRTCSEYGDDSAEPSEAG